MIELSLKYYSLFKVSVKHTFYSNESQSGLKIVPLEETLQKIKKLGLLLKRSQAEYYTLYEGDRIEGMVHQMNENNAPLKFTFLLYATEPYFINITDLPTDNFSMYYFSNSTGTSENGSFRLHQENFAGRTDRFRVISNLSLTYEKEQEVEIKDGFGNPVLKKVLHAGEKLVLSNNNLPVGKYNLWEGGKLKDSFILFSDIPVVKPIGIIDIFISGKFKEEIINGIAALDIPSYRFEINFSSRQTFWKYFLIGKYNSNLHHTQIESGEKKYSFQGPSETVMKNGQKAFVFISENPIPLKQIYDFGFQLKSTKSGISNGKILMEHLPLASPEIIKPDSRKENSKIYSEIIVHI